MWFSSWRFAALLLASVAVPAMPAAAQTSEVAYCAQLAQLVQQYIGTAGMGSGRSRTPKTVWAVEQCNTRNAAEAIAVLELVLRDNGFTLPTR